MKKDFEYYLENNRLRAFVRDTMEIRPLRNEADVGAIGKALQIACGVGSSSTQIMRVFSPAFLTAIERERELVDIARATHDPELFDFRVGDVFSMDFDEGEFDAVFNLADLHNYSEWKVALSALWRVLRPGGALVMEDMSRESFEYGAGRVFKRLTDHPYEDMMAVDEFKRYAIEIGFEILSFRQVVSLGLLKHFIMIARKV